MKQLAIHSVEYLKDGKPTIAKPGEIFDVPEESAAALKKLGASRDLTQDELILEKYRTRSFGEMSTEEKSEEPGDADKGEAHGVAKAARRVGKASKGGVEDI